MNSLLSNLNSSTWIRNWKILLSAQNNNVLAGNTFDVSGLRCVFTVNVSPGGISNCALQIYNMNAQAGGTVLKKGYNVKIFAGYQGFRYGVIFDGTILQTFRRSQSDADDITEIFAINAPLQTQNHINKSIGSGSDPRETLNFIGSNSKTKFKINNVTNKLNKQKLPRGQTFFGDPHGFLRNIAYFDNSYSVINEKGNIDVVNFNDSIPASMAIDIGQDNSIIGSPSYSDECVKVAMLLDPRIKLRSIVKIGNNIVPLLNLGQSSEYAVVSLTHAGDTNGNDWKTEVIGFSQNKGILTTQERLV